MTSERDLMREEFEAELAKMPEWAPEFEQHRAWVEAFAWNLWQAQAQAARHAQLSTAEPFGYFRADPFGWTDCAETDEGAKALYEAAPQQAPDHAALLAEVEALRKKAARYDWLRDNWGYVTETYTGSGPQVESVYLVSKDDGWDTDPDSLDAAIDAALRAKEAEHG